MANSTTSQKHYKYITSSIVTCKHTGVKISISNHFHNVRSLRLQCVHPIFSATNEQLEDMILRADTHKLTATEKYLATVAYLVKNGVVDTTKHHLHLDSFTSSTISLLMPKLILLMRQHNTTNLIVVDKNNSDIWPLYAVTAANCDDSSALVAFLKVFINYMEQFYSSNGIMHKSESYLEDMFLKQELVRINNGHNNSLPTKFIKLKFLNYARTVATPEQLEVLRNTLMVKTATKYPESLYKQVAEWIRITVPGSDISEQAQNIKAMILRYYDAVVAQLSDVGFDISFDVDKPLGPLTVAQRLEAKSAAKGGTSAMAALAKLRKPVIRV